MLKEVKKVCVHYPYVYPIQSLKCFVSDPSGSLTTSPIRAASEIQAFRNVVLKDIIDSEKAHVAEMQGLVSNFLQPLEKSEM